MAHEIRVLCVDDEADLLEVGKQFLEQEGGIVVDTALSAPAALEILNKKTYDVIVSDYQMPGMDGIELLKRVRSLDKNLPFIMFTGRGREEIVIEALNNGADFYLQKGGAPDAVYTELIHVIRQAVLMRRTQLTLAEQEQRYHDLQNASDLIQSVAPDGHFLFVNKKWLDTLGYTEAELPDLSIFDIIHEESLQHCMETFQRVISGENVGIIDAAFRTRDGTKVYVEGMANCRQVEGICQYTRGLFKDVTSRKKAEQELLLKNEDLNAAYEELTATEEELRHNYELLSRNEQALRESEEKYRRLTEVTDDVIYMIDIQGMITHISPRISRFGYTQEEVISRNFTEFIAKEDVTGVMADFEKAVSTRQTLVTTFRIRDKAGNLHWMEDNGAPVYDSSGSMIALSGILRDVTGRRNAEEALTESEKKFRTIFENSPYPIAMNSIPEGKFIAVNTAFLDSSGYSEAEVLGKSPVELGLLSLPDFGRLSSHMLVSGRLEHVPMALVGKGGKRVHVLFSTIPVTIDDRHAILTMTAEVTKLKRVEEDLLRKNEDLNAACEELTATAEELRQNYDELRKKEEVLRTSEEKFRVLVELSLDGIFITDFAGNLLFVNRAAGLIVDTPEYEAIIGKKNVLEFVAPESQADVLHDIRQVARGIDAYLVHYKLVTGTKREIWVECIGKKILFQDAEAMLVSMRDVTERRIAEEALRQANKKLNLLSRLTRHDIRNQLMTLNGFVVLLNKKIPDPSYEMYFSRITAASNQITNMIQFTKEYEQIGVHAPVWQDIRTLVDTAGNDAARGQVTLKNDLPAGTEVFADPLIIKVFYNLMDNAVRHGGKITTIRFSLEERDGDRVIVCADDGEGIATEEKEKIFDLGFGKNTGFGLAISREILDITGITIKETGEPAHGARFEIAVPKGAHRQPDKNGKKK